MLCRYWSSWIPFYSVDQVSISNIKSINQFFVQSLLSVTFHEDKNNLRFTPTISVLGIIWFVYYSNYTHFLFHINFKNSQTQILFWIFMLKQYWCLKYCFDFSIPPQLHHRMWGSGEISVPVRPEVSTSVALSRWYIIIAVH